MTACWSGCVVGGQSLGLPWKQGSTKSKYGPIVLHVWPPLVVSATSSSPRYTWAALAGSTAMYWLYQVCAPGNWPSGGSAEPELASFVASAISVHGPAGLPLF